jgi:hypothetical protein
MAEPPEVILFEHPNFRGAHRHVFQQENDLSITNKVNKAHLTAGASADGNFAAVTSSIIVVRGTWLFFAKKGCDGHAVQLPPEGELAPQTYRNFDAPNPLADNEILSLRPK